MTAKAETRDVVAGLDAGGDDYLTKPFEHAALLARVRSMLRVKELHDTVREQAARLEPGGGACRAGTRRSRSASRAERRDRAHGPPPAVPVAADRRHRRSSQASDDALLESHRREITVVFCDLRGFTAFTETSEPEEVMAILREYHECVGRLIFQYEGTLERFLGDGIMVVFNDPVQCADHCARAVRLALDMRDCVGALTQRWAAEGHSLGFGIGIATGYATVGLIGFDKRRDYTAIGRVTNLASRLCDRAKAGQVVVAQRTFTAVAPSVKSEALGEIPLKGFNKPMPVYEIVAWLGDGSQPAPPQPDEALSSIV